MRRDNFHYIWGHGVSVEQGRTRYAVSRAFSTCMASDLCNPRHPQSQLSKLECDCPGPERGVASYNLCKAHEARRHSTRITSSRSGPLEYKAP